MSNPALDRMEALAANAARVLHHKTRSWRLLVLYPHHRQHMALIALLHKHYGDSFYFYTINHDEPDLKTLVRNLSYDPMFPIGFGEQTRRALHQNTHPSAWGQGLAKDLSDLHPHPYMIFLDKLDRLNLDDHHAHTFFEQVGHHLPEHVQILIGGAELNRQVWLNLQQHGLAKTLGDDETLGSGIFEDPDLQGQLEVYALSGGSRVMVDGRPITAWEGSLPRDLFYFFIDKPTVTRTEVFETFWPDHSLKEATNVFHVTKRKINEKLGYDLTSYENGFYSPNPRLKRVYDARIFEQMVDKAMNTPEDTHAEADWFKAVQIYRGQFLKDVDRPWANQRRSELREMYTQALISLAHLYRKQGNLEQALAFYVRAAGEKPDREDVYRNVIQIYAHQGREDELRWAYRQLEETLQTKFNIAPSAETRQLYEHLTNQH